jgi:integrase/recombinase XerD
MEKGSKTRAIVFTQVTGALLQRWLDHRQPVDTLFYSLETWEALKPNSLYLLFKRLAKRAGVKERFSPHTFRHAFGKEYVKAGGDIATLSRIMGHEDVNTTIKHYSIFTDSEVAAAHEKFSPVKQLQEKMERKEE